MKLPIVYSAHHASCDFLDYTDRINLDAFQRKKFSDYGTEVTVPRNGIKTHVASSSRALGDLNRSPDHPLLFPSHDFAKPVANKLWKDSRELTNDEIVQLKKSLHEKYHLDLIKSLKNTNLKKILVVAWDNTAQYAIGKDESGLSVMMPSIILSNGGDENQTSSKTSQTTCNPETLAKLKQLFEELLSRYCIEGSVETNLVFKGGYIAEFYNTRRHQKDLEKLGIHADIESLQIEYSTAITHDQNTLEPIEGRMELLRTIAEDAFGQLIEYLEQGGR